MGIVRQYTAAALVFTPGFIEFVFRMHTNDLIMPAALGIVFAGAGHAFFI